MKRNPGSILVLLLIILGQAACTPSAVPSAMPSEVPSAVPSEAPSAVPTVPLDSNECPAPGAGQALLKNDADGYCLIYPAEYSTDLLPGYIVINPVPGPGDIPGDAWVYVNVVPASGRSAAQAADQEISDVGPGFNITRSETTVDGSQAIVVDGLPSTDSVRKVFVVNNDRLYTIWFMPWLPGEGGPTPLENLYSTVLGSLHFFPPAGAP